MRLKYDQFEQHDRGVVNPVASLKYFRNPLRTLAVNNLGQSAIDSKILENIALCPGSSYSGCATNRLAAVEQVQRRARAEPFELRLGEGVI